MVGNSLKLFLFVGLIFAFQACNNSGPMDPVSSAPIGTANEGSLLGKKVNNVFSMVNAGLPDQ